MKKIMLKLTLFFSSLIPLFGQSVPVEYNSLNDRSWVNIKSYDNKVAAIHYYLDLFDGFKWNNIPLIYMIDDNKYDTIKYSGSNTSNIEFDNYGNLWTCGIGGYFKYDGSEWHKYYLDDDFASRREYTRICFDSLGNTWLTAEFSIGDTIIDGMHIIKDFITQLIKYNGMNYSILDSTHGLCNGFGYDYGLVTVRDGRVFAHKFDVTYNNVGKDLLYIYDIEGNKDSLTIPNPHYIVSPSYRKVSTYINQIFEDSEGNFWFGLGSINTKDNENGLVMMKNDGSWHAFTGEDGYQSIYFPPFQSIFGWDTAYSSCKGIAQEKSGRIWLSGGYLNTYNGKISKPDSIDFFNNIILYAGYIPSDTIYYNYKLFFRDSIFTLVYNLLNQIHYGCNFDICTGGGLVSGITTTSDESIWFSIRTLGVLRYKPGANGVEDLPDFTSEVSLYPQPVSLNEPKFTISFTTPINFSIIKVFDITGKVIFTKDLEPVSAQDKFEIELPNGSIPAGCYFAGIFFNDKILFRKIIIQ